MHPWSSVFQISSKLGQMYSEMIFQRGYIHCDPHPGNVLVRRKVGDRGRRGRGEVEIVLLDHGLYTVSPLLPLLPFSTHCLPPLHRYSLKTFG